jgi:DNA repair exonuclease SbcCD ATPase subunit
MKNLEDEFKELKVLIDKLSYDNADRYDKIKEIIRDVERTSIENNAELDIKLAQFETEMEKRISAYESMIKKWIASLCAGILTVIAALDAIFAFYK